MWPPPCPPWRGSGGASTLLHGFVSGRVRTDCRSWTSFQPVADAPHRRQLEAVAQLSAQLADMDVDSSFVADPAHTPHAVEQLAAGQGQPAVLGQVGEQV